MDYIEAFRNLRTNNKYGRRSPHKAVLMLTVIELFEKSILTDNEIYYDDKLKSMFLKVWNRVLPNEPRFHPDAYLPFWYLQNDNFWHIVPVRGKEDILSLMRDTNVKPSETKLNDSVRCAELDNDLYFLMTMPSGRSSLKRVLLETYTTLSEKQIDEISESSDNIIDYSVSALSDYKEILTKNRDTSMEETAKVDDDLICQFQKLNEDLQIVLNLEYFSFLKKHRSERDMFKRICPTVYDMYDKIANHPVKQGDLSLSFAFTYENFLAEVKIALMSENDSMELIDKINTAIEILHGKIVQYAIPEFEEIIDFTDATQEQETASVEKSEENNIFEVEHVFLDSSGNVVDTVISNQLHTPAKEEKESRKGKTWTKEEEELITRYYQQGKDTATIAELVGRTDIAIKSRLAKLGLIEYTYKKDEAISSNQSRLSQDSFKIKNTSTRSYTEKSNLEGRKTLEYSEISRITQNPLYAVRKQAILRAMSYFRQPTEIKDITKVISRTAWGAPIREDDVEIFINTISEVENVGGKYMLKKDS